MSDLIDRRQAIDAVEQWEDDHTWDDWCNEHKDEKERFRIVPPSDYIRSLPSAEPEIIRCKDCKHRYMEDMTWHCPFGLMGGENFFCGYGSLGTVEVEGLPSAEPVIRCKDCVYWDVMPSSTIAPEYHECVERPFHINMRADDFCGRARRRTDGSD